MIMCSIKCFTKCMIWSNAKQISIWRKYTEETLCMPYFKINVHVCVSWA